MADKTHKQTGFALLVSIIVVSVVISIGLVLLDVTTKQLRLSSNSTDSEQAFHAANAGMECARYVRRNARLQIEGDEFASPRLDPAQDISGVFCFGEQVVAEAGTNVDVDDLAGEGQAFAYQYEISWGGDRCSEITMGVAVANLLTEGPNPVEAGGLTVSSALLQERLPGYPPDQDIDCPAGSSCTVILAKGYNRSCADKNSFGTVQREVLLEF